MEGGVAQPAAAGVCPQTHTASPASNAPPLSKCHPSAARHPLLTWRAASRGHTASRSGRPRPHAHAASPVSRCVTPRHTPLTWRAASRGRTASRSGRPPQNTNCVTPEQLRHPPVIASPGVTRCSHGGRLPEVAQPVVAGVRHRAAALVRLDGAERVVLRRDGLGWGVRAWRVDVFQWQACATRAQGERHGSVQVARPPCLAPQTAQTATAALPQLP